MNQNPLSKSYIDHVKWLEERLRTDEALRQAVGGEFIATGKLEYYLLRACGLRDDQLVVDVGCGSGRLAYQLAPLSHLRYIGCDVVPKLIEYASDLCKRPDWWFECTDGAIIPCASGTADFACFFSVFTHLCQEDIFRYIQESHRVLKPGGLVVLSFLEMRLPTHWPIFMASVNGTRNEEHLNQFIDREAIYTWAEKAGFDVWRIYPGNTEYIPLPDKVRFESGAVMTGAGSLGQSVAILQKRDVEMPLPSESSEGTLPFFRTTSASSLLDPLPATNLIAPILNASVRCRVSNGRAVMFGFTVGGLLNRRVLVRAIGPSLTSFGVTNIVERPKLRIVNGNDEYAQNTKSWGDAPELIAAAKLVGAFPLLMGSSDAALVAWLRPGSYTAVVTTEEGEADGEVLIEVYLVD